MFDESVMFGLFPKLDMLRDFPRNSSAVHAERVWAAHFGSDKIYEKEAWNQLQNMGYLPVSIRAIPEGMLVPTRVPMLTIENTHPDFAWLPNWLETQLMQVWYPITVATLSREIKKLILKYLKLTGDPAGIDFKLHDFGFRGVSSLESAAIGGAAHLVNFLGTDTAVALEYLEYYYKANIEGKNCPGYSIPAAEHFTITSWGRSREGEAYKNMLDTFPDGLVAVVSDSYDIYNACLNLWGGELKAQVLDRNGTVVIRPDSGYPPDVVRKCLEILGKQFGFTTNDKGFKVLNPKIRIIQGDGVDYDMIRNVLHEMYVNKWSADNVAFGMGGALLQKLNRDTQKMALKCSETTCDGEVIPVFKDPVTDSGKRSDSGRFAVIKQDGVLTTVPGPHKDDVMQEVFRDGAILEYPSIYEVRKRASVV